MIIDCIQNKNNIEKYRKKIIHYLEDQNLKSIINYGISFQNLNVIKSFEIILKNANINYYKIKFNSNIDIQKANSYCSDLFLGNIHIKSGLMVCEAIQIIISWLNLLKNGVVYSFYYDTEQDLYVLEINN